MISDYYRDRTFPGNPYPNVYPPSVVPNSPVPNVFIQPQLPPINVWDQESKQLLREVLERLDKLDKRLGDIECHDDSKAALRKELGLD